MEKREKPNKLIIIVVSKNYHLQLSLFLKRNTPLVDQLIVVTQEDDIDTTGVVNEQIDRVRYPDFIQKVKNTRIKHIHYPLDMGKHNPNIHAKSPYSTGIESQVLVPNGSLLYVPAQQNYDFTDDLNYGYPCFDKGGAQRLAQEQIDEDDAIILCLDSDVILTKEIVEYLKYTEFEYDVLYGANRKDVSNLKDFRQKKNIKQYFRWNALDGYFHMYRHSPDNVRKFRRSYSAAYVDTAFKALWCRGDKHPEYYTAANDQGLDILPEEFFVYHLGHDPDRVYADFHSRWRGKTGGNFAN